ncbi:dihydrofolate reductase [Natronorarus salvus]|uniref:dihydrofolate reductase n=1 Tax=Natronorarus salvus TaxID=3117733 RepID=UPI002F26BF6C
MVEAAAGHGDVDLVLIAAVAENCVIGSDGEMPWHYPEDLRRFKEVTTGHPVVMGRRTYEAIEARLGGPLPDRTNVVLSRGDPEVPEGAIVVGCVEEAVGAARETGAETAFVIGGATVYETFLPFADRMLLTEIHTSYEGDTYFPEFDREEWTEAGRDERAEFAFVTYERR